MAKDIQKVKLTDDSYKEFMQTYGNKPIRFMREVCGIEPYEWQKRFLTALHTDKFIVRPSGHGTGKTTVTAVAMLWMLLAWEDCHIKATSVTYDQMHDILWNTFKQVISHSAVAMWINVDESKAVNKAFPNHWAVPKAWSKDKPDAWAGEHCKHPVAIFDECADIDESIFEAWSGSANHAGSRTILLGQPTKKSGKLFNSANNPDYNVEHLSCEDLPSQADFVKSAINDYGEESDYYRIRVLGLFPNVDNSCMFPNASLKQLEVLEPEAVAGVPIAGLDLAGGGGDKTVLAVRRKNVVVGVHEFEFGENVLLSSSRDAIMNTLKRYGCNVLAMDTNGIGDGLGKFFRELKDFTLVPVVGSRKARNEAKYHNRRAEAYGRLADAWNDLKFLRGGVGPESLKKIAMQLTATRQFFDKDMRIQILEKKELKKELKGESPDHADALAYSFMFMNESITPEARNERMLAIRRIQMNSNPYR